jgi:phage shock protein PspC (stress-responsive transcriptional regulator)
MEPKRLFRNSSDKVIAGVCSGLGDYFDLDHILVRLIFIVLVLAGGSGVLIYLILWIATPEKPVEFHQSSNTSTMENQQTNWGQTPGQQTNPSPETPGGQEKHDRRNRGNLIGGLVLITVGAIFLADEFLPNVNFGDLWPVILIVIGIGLLINVVGRRKNG